MNTTSTLRSLACLTVIAAALIGCEKSARRIDPAGTETITTVGELDIQDATDAAAGLSQSLLESGVLGKGGRPSTIAISNYVNNTSRQIDRDAVVKKIRVTLNKAGVAQTYTTIAVGAAEDSIAAKQQKVDDFLGDKKAPTRPDYTLTFKILDNRASAGRTRQTTYIFQMSLTDVNTGLAVWEEEKSITKQGTKGSVGW